MNPPSVAFVVCVCLLGGCCRREQPRSEAAPDPDALAQVLANLRATAVDLPVVPSDAPGRAPTWAAPVRCAPRWTLRASVSVHQRPGEGQAMTLRPDRLTLEIAGDFAAEGAKEAMTLGIGQVALFHLRGGARKPGFVHAEGSLAPILLDLGRAGAGWLERDGPASFWSAFGNFPGLTIFFPDLPRSGAPGAEAEWALALNRPESSVGVESRRGAMGAGGPGSPPSASPAEVARARVRLSGFAVVAGEPVALLASSWTTGASPPPPATPLPVGASTVTRGAFRGNHALRSDGLLLWGRVSGEAVTRVRLPAKALDLVVEQVVALDAETRLVGGCPGLVLPDFPPLPQSGSGADPLPPPPGE